MNVQHFEVFSGENRTLTMTARDESNVAVSLSGKTIACYFGRSPRNLDSEKSIFTVTGTATVTASGIFTVAITPSNTQDMEGDYAYQAKTTDGSSNVAVVSVGRFRVRPTIEA